MMQRRNAIIEQLRGDIKSIPKIVDGHRRRRRGVACTAVNRPKADI